VQQDGSYVVLTSIAMDGFILLPYVTGAVSATKA
jgi:hypothetical protein